MKPRSSALALLTVAGLGAAFLLITRRPPDSTAVASSLALSPSATPGKSPHRPGPATHPDPGALTPEKQQAATRLADQMLGCLRDLRDRHQTLLQLPEDLSEALAHLDAGQHRLIMNALIDDETLSSTIRAMMGDQISSYWLQAHDSSPEQSRAACISAFATLSPLATRFHDGMGQQLASSSLDYTAQRQPDLATLWFNDHLALYDNPNISPDVDSFRARLLQSMSWNPAAALGQIDALTPQNPAQMYTAVAKTAVTFAGWEKTTAAFQSAEQAAADPATAALIHQAYLAGLSQGITTTVPETTFAWIDAGHLSEDDQRSLLEQITLPADPSYLNAWVTWLGEKIPAADLDSKLAAYATQGATHSPAETAQAIAALPDGPSRDAAVHAFATTVSDSAAAARLAAFLPEDHPDRPELLHPTGQGTTDFLGRSLKK